MWKAAICPRLTANNEDFARFSLLLKNAEKTLTRY